VASAQANRSRSGAPVVADAGVAGGPLDLHEGISDADPAARSCGRWPEHMRLLSSQGEVVRGRCRATNQCAYCARLAAVENAELLALDALAGNAPEVWAVLTTRTPSMDPARFYESRRQVMRALKRRWPAAEYAALVEFTTGYGPLSGGLRRPHWNLLLKGIPAADVDQARDVITSVWCAREDAEPWGQHVGPITEAGGLMRYIALHFQKQSQQPPAGWRGHRFTKSRGYLATSTPQAREQARASLRHKRELWRAFRRGLEGHDAELAAHEALELAAATTWRVIADPAIRRGARGRGACAQGLRRPVRASTPSITVDPGAVAAPERRLVSVARTSPDGHGGAERTAGASDSGGHAPTPRAPLGAGLSDP
jgi:hypothetical protein